MSTPPAILSVRGLSTSFPARDGGRVRAVQDVSFDVPRGQIVGLVGESGSGKTTVGRSILRLVDPDAGEVLFEGENILALSDSAMKARRKRMQIVFQDPHSSLNPRMRVSAILDEALETHGLSRGIARKPRIAELLASVGLNADHANRYPHEFSGGQRQRIGIARALAVEPAFIVADEPVSALDVSVQAQVINLILELKQRLGLSLLFITHDLAVVEFLCDQVVVMYLGRVMETGRASEVFANARHPYTRALLSAAPVPDPKAPRGRILLQGDIPNPLNPPSGCVFRTRCPSAIAACADIVPPMQQLSEGHQAACIRLDDLKTP